MFGSIFKAAKSVIQPAMKVIGQAPIPLAGNPAGGFLSGLGGIAPWLGFGSTFLTNRQQMGLAREQMNFQKHMSGTAYQRQMQDMRNAGLNPILAGKMGGASTPAGAQAQLKDPGQHAATALALRRLHVEAKKIYEDANLSRSKADAIDDKLEPELKILNKNLEKLTSEITLNVEKTKNTKQLTNLYQAQFKLTRNQAYKLAKEFPRLDIESQYYEDNAETYRMLYKVIRYKEAAGISPAGIVTTLLGAGAGLYGLGKYKQGFNLLQKRMGHKDKWLIELLDDIKKSVKRRF